MSWAWWSDLEVNPLLRVLAVVVVRRARSLRGHHARADRRLRRARRPKDLALPGTQDALEDFTALTCLGVCHANPRNIEDELGVERRVSLGQRERRLRD